VQYRRWRSGPSSSSPRCGGSARCCLVRVPDTGSLRGDVFAVLRRIPARLAEVGPETVYGLLGEYFADSELFAEIDDDVFLPLVASPS
jgi:Tetracyclin repressor-like, C-terminal domain